MMMLSLVATTPAALTAIVLDASLKAAVAAVVAAALARLLRREPARVRYRVWLGALIVTAIAVTVALTDAASGVAHAAAVVLPRDRVPAPLATLLLWVWAFGALAHAVTTAAGFAALALDRRCLPVAREEAWRRHVEKARAALGLRTKVRVLYGQADAVPVCWGLFGGTIVVPSAAVGWSHRLRHAVVLHECAHLRRRDPLVMLAEQIVCTVLWFNPAVWLIVGRLRRDRELACDEVVVTAGVRPDIYARLLVALARACRPSEAPAHAIVRACGMQERIAALLADEPPTARRRHRGALLAAGVAVAFLSLSRVITIAAPSQPAPFAGQPGESPASFRAGLFEGDR